MTGLRRTTHQLSICLSLTILLSAAAYAQPTITSVTGLAFGGNVPVSAITSGTAAQSFQMTITGTFNQNLFESVTWFNTVTSQSQTFTVQSETAFAASPTTVIVTIPRTLYGTLVSSPQPVQITVAEADFLTLTFAVGRRLAPRAVSNPGTFTINPPLTSLGPGLPGATRGGSYNSPYVSGGTGPYVRALPNNMPANLTIATGTPQNVTGVCNTAGFFTFQPTITDAWLNTLSPPLGLHCVNAASLSSLSPNSTIANSGALTVVATGNNFEPPGSVATSAPSAPVQTSVVVPGSRVVWNGTPLTTSVSSASQLTFTVPANLVLNPGTATVQVVQPDSQASNGVPFTIVSPIPPLVITTASVPAGTAGTPYSAGFSAMGGSGGYSFSVSSGSLPGGLVLTSDGGLSGTPTAPGTFRFSVMVTDSAGRTAAHDYVLVIAPPPLVVTGTVSDVPLGSTLSVKFSATGGTPPYTFAASGSIPSGTTFSAGTLSGTTNSQGTFVFTVAATDSQGVVATKTFTIRVTAPTLTVTGSLGNGTVALPYSGQVGAANGTPPYTFSASGLPGGVSLSSGGAASGTPTAEGTFSVVVTVTDSTGLSATRTFPVIIDVAPLTISTTSLPTGTVGSAYTASVAATGGVPPYVWSASGLPDGITGGSGGTLGGTPTAPGTSSVSVTVTDSKGTKASKTLSLVVVAPPLSITTASLPAGLVGSPYSASVGATGGIPPYTFSASGLPGGLSMAPGGSIGGTPTATGTFNASVTVRDSLGTTASRGLTVAIALPTTPPVSFTGLPPTANPATQPVVTIGLGSAYPVNVTVILTLTFAPDSGADDPSVQFASGGRTTQTVIPVGSTTAPGVALQTGTVAGTITITTRLSAATQDITPTPVPTQTIRINATAPVLQSVTATRNSTGFTVVITGFASSRELTQAVFTFTAASGTNLQATTLTIPIDTLFSAYYQSATSAPFGSQFLLTQPFTVQGGTTGIVSVSVTLASRVGSSNAVSANLQ